ncbi:hypothetical protein CCP3SC1_460022 [Gammaproteobacteria bacterium]
MQNSPGDWFVRFLPYHDSLLAMIPGIIQPFAERYARMISTHSGVNAPIGRVSRPPPPLDTTP